MENGEIRSRIDIGDASVSVTIMPEGEEVAWQPSHYHMGVMETYLVLRGVITLAIIKKDGAKVRRYTIGKGFTIRPTEIHSIRMYSGAIISTAKYGTPVLVGDTTADWYPSLELDEWLARLHSS